MPVTFNLPGDLSAFNEWLSRSFAEGIRKGSLSAGFRIVQLITTEIIPSESPPPVFVGAYRAAWHAEPTATGADIVNTMPYASVIEDGARGENIKIGRVMIDAIANWVLRKGLLGKVGRSGSERRQQQDVQARSVAWAIAVNMKKRGIFNRDGSQGLGIGRKALYKGRAVLADEVAKAIFAETERR